MAASDTPDEEIEVDTPEASNNDEPENKVEQADEVIQEGDTNVSYNERTDTTGERLLADGVAAIVVVSLPLFIFMLLVSFAGAAASAVGVVWMTTYTLILVMSATRLFGKGILRSARDVVFRMRENTRSR